MDTLLRFAHISDTHYAPPDYDRPPSRFNPVHGVTALIKQVNALTPAPDFILHTGDVAYDPYPDIYDEIKTAFTAFEAPLMYVPGNHDHTATLQTALMGRTDPTVPLYHAEERGGIRIIYLDSNDGDTPPPAGHIGAAQLDWLREQLAVDERPLVIAVHHPLVGTGFSEWYDEFMRTDNGDEVHAVLVTAQERIRGVFYGHVHQNITFYRDGLMYSAVNSSWTQFVIRPGQEKEHTLNDTAADPAFNVVTVTKAGTIVQRHTYRVDGES